MRHIHADTSLNKVWLLLNDKSYFMSINSHDKSRPYMPRIILFIDVELYN